MTDDRQENDRQNLEVFLNIPIEKWGLKIEQIKQRLKYATFISLNRKYFYCETPKVACTSIKKLIQKLENIPEIEPDFLWLSGSKPSMNIHLRSCFKMPTLMEFDKKEAQKIIEEEEYFKFAFVRNPYSRMFSAWQNKVYLVEPGMQGLVNEIYDYFPDLDRKQLIPFDRFVKYVCSNHDSKYCNGHWRSQVYLIFPHAINYNFIGRLENFKEDFQLVWEKIGNGDLEKFLTTSNKSIKKNWREYYNEELAEMVYQFHRQDFDYFDYDQNSWHQEKAKVNVYLDNKTDDNNENLHSYYEQEIYERNQKIEILHSEIKRLQKITFSTTATNQNISEKNRMVFNKVTEAVSDKQNQSKINLDKTVLLTEEELTYEIIYSQLEKRNIKKDSDEFISQSKHLQKRLNFLKLMPKGGVVAEIGVHKGYFTNCILHQNQPDKLYLIDPWFVVGKEWTWGKGNRSTVDALIGLLDYYKTEFAEGKLMFNVGWDEDVLVKFEDNFFDWVYLDTSHQYKHTLRELEILKSKVKPTGIIAGDDWHPRPEHKHHGVFKAVKEFVEKEPYTIIYESTEDNQWAIQRITEFKGE